MGDAVHQPDHYKSGGIESIDYIFAKLGEQGFRAYCVGNVLKYASRYESKNGTEDLRKAQVYLGWAIAGSPAVKLQSSPRKEQSPASMAAMERVEALADSVEFPPSCKTGGCDD